MLIFISINFKGTYDILQTASVRAEACSVGEEDVLYRICNLSDTIYSCNDVGS